MQTVGTPVSRPHTVKLIEGAEDVFLNSHCWYSASEMKDFSINDPIKVLIECESIFLWFYLYCPIRNSINTCMTTTNTL